MPRAPRGTKLATEAEREEDRVEASRGMQPLKEQRRLARRCFFISDAPDPELSEFRKVVRRLGRAVPPSDDDVPIVAMAADPAFVEQ